MHAPDRSIINLKEVEPEIIYEESQPTNEPHGGESSVREYLRTRGVDPSRIMVNGRGESQPIASNDTAQGRAENRRVEVFLSEPARG